MICSSKANRLFVTVLGCMLGLDRAALLSNNECHYWLSKGCAQSKRLPSMANTSLTTQHIWAVNHVTYFTSCGSRTAHSTTATNLPHTPTPLTFRASPIGAIQTAVQAAAGAHAGAAAAPPTASHAAAACQASSSPPARLPTFHPHPSTTHPHPSNFGLQVTLPVPYITSEGASPSGYQLRRSGLRGGTDRGGRGCTLQCCCVWGGEGRCCVCVGWQRSRRG